MLPSFFFFFKVDISPEDGNSFSETLLPTTQQTLCHNLQEIEQVGTPSYFQRLSPV
jgi:hypothetical protein